MPLGDRDNPRCDARETPFRRATSDDRRAPYLYAAIPVTRSGSRAATRPDNPSCDARETPFRRATSDDRRAPYLYAAIPVTRSGSRAATRPDNPRCDARETPFRRATSDDRRAPYLYAAIPVTRRASRAATRPDNPSCEARERPLRFDGRQATSDERLICMPRSPSPAGRAVPLRARIIRAAKPAKGRFVSTGDKRRATSALFVCRDPRHPQGEPCRYAPG